MLRRSTTVYDLAGRSLASINALLARTTTVYDVAGQSVASIDPFNKRTSTVYDLAGRSLASINALGQRTSTVYDAAGESVGRIDALGRRSSTVYDRAGRTLASINPLLARTTTVYDIAGQSVGSIDPLLRRSSTVYDRAGRTLASINPLLQRTSTVYDAAGQSVASINALAYRVSHVYDLAGRTIALINPRGYRTSSVFNAAGWQVQQIDPLLRRTTYGYDPVGQRTLVLDARALRITSIYDAAGQRTAELLPAGQRSSYVYDLVGRRVLLSGPEGRTSTVYDAKGRVQVVKQPTVGRVSYAYDVADRQVVVTDPDGGRTSYVHDAAGQLSSVSAPNMGRTSLSYDLVGRQVARLSTSARFSQSYDVAGQLLVTASGGSGGSVSRSSYTYDQASRRLRTLGSDGSRASYSYDPSGQLTHEWRTGGPAPLNTTYLYDPTGNRTVLIDSGLRTTSTFDGADQLLLDQAVSGRTTYINDNVGNRTQTQQPSAITYFTFDVKNRMTQAEPVAGTVNLLYDGDGKRLSKQTTTATTLYVYDFEKVLQEADAAGTTNKQYASTQEQYGDLLSAYGGGETSHYGFDCNNNTDAMLAPDGTLQDKYAYRAFGLATQTTGTDSNPYTFGGKQGYRQDSEYGLYFLRARYYDPVSARFVGRDPDGFSAGDANLFRYVFNDPLNHTDPSGKRVLVPECEITDFPYSPTNDILRDEISREYQETTRYKTGSLYFSGRDNVLGYDYGVVNLLDAYRSSFWPKVRSVNHHLSELLLVASNSDLVIRGRGNNGNRSLDWREPKQSWSYWWNKKAEDFVAAIKLAGSTGIEGLTHGLGDFVQNLVLAGMASLLDQVRFYLSDSFNPNAFLDLFNQFQRVGDLALAVFNDPIKVAKTLGTGVADGFTNFLNNIGQNLQDAFFGWLFEELKKTDPTLEFPQGELTITKAAGFALELMGLTVDAILGLVRMKAPKAYGVALGVYDLLSAVYEKGLNGLTDLLAGKAAGLLGGDPELKDALQSGLGDGSVDLNQVFTLALNAGAAVIKDQVVTALKDKVLKALLALADVTGINAAISAVQSIYEAVVFAIDKAKKLKEFVQTLLQGVENLINGDAQGLTTVVVTGLKKVLGLVLPFVLTQVGLGGVPKKVDESIQGVRDRVQMLLNDVLDGLLGVGKQLLGLGNAQEVSDEDNNRLTKKVPSQDKKVQVWLQKDGKTTVVKVQASPTRNLEDVLQCMLANASGSLKSEIQTDLNQVQATQNRGQSLAVEANQPVPKGKTGTTTGGDAPAKKRQQIQTKDLVAEANILAKPEYACMLNSCALAGPGGKAGAKNPSGTCIDIGSEVLFKWERANLGVSRVGRRLKGEGMVPCRAYDPDQLRLLRLELEYGDGNGVEAQLLRDGDWTEQNHAVEGSVLWLDLPEIGLSGWAKVCAVDGCPEIEEGDGPLVTGWFKHRSGKVYDLVIEGESKSIGITGTHPVWGVDRQDWVPAAELREGERLLAEEGSTPRVRSLSLRAGSEPVYNIEVDGEHCYRVGRQGLLVHNASVDLNSIDKIALGPWTNETSFWVELVDEKQLHHLGWILDPGQVGYSESRNKLALGHLLFCDPPDMSSGMFTNYVRTMTRVYLQQASLKRIYFDITNMKQLSGGLREGLYAFIELNIVRSDNNLFVKTSFWENGELVYPKTTREKMMQIISTIMEGKPT